MKRAILRTALGRNGLVVAATCAGLAMGCDSPVQQGAAPAPAAAGRAGSGAAARRDQQTTDNTPTTTPSAGAGGSASTGAATATGDGGTASRPPPLALNDNDFTESDRTRDPFRSFAREFVPVGPQVQVVENEIRLREYALDDLDLVAVIVGTDNPYAMVVDPTGRGTIIRRGDYVGRPETISGGAEGTIPHQVPWRVARIVGSRVRRASDNNLTEVPGEVVFEREDRLNPTVGRAERSLTLGPSATATAQPGQGGASGNTVAPSGLPPLPGFGGAGSPYLPSFAPPPAGATGTPGAPRTTSTVTPGPGGSVVQSYTTVIPPQQAPAPQPQTLVIQTGPQGQTTVTPGGGSSPPPSQPAAQRPPNPLGPPPGGSNAPPPIQTTEGPTGGSSALPTSGLGR